MLGVEGPRLDFLEENQTAKCECECPYGRAAAVQINAPRALGGQVAARALAEAMGADTCA